MDVQWRRAVVSPHQKQDVDRTTRELLVVEALQILQKVEEPLLCDVRNVSGIASHRLTQE